MTECDVPGEHTCGRHSVERCWPGGLTVQRIVAHYRREHGGNYPPHKTHGGEK